MKSVMEEAPSVAKAVEQAWERVGKPREFTVKIFEEAKRSFFGFTKQSAKIALIFDERTLTEKPKPTQEQSTYTKTTTDKQKQKFKKPSTFAKTSSDKQRPAPRQPAVTKTVVEKPREHKPQDKDQKSLWNDEMVNNARAWVQQNLKIIGLPDIKFNTSTQKYHLRFQFETCVLENREKEKKLFSAFAHLIMATMRSKFKKEFRGLKVVLSSS